MASPSDDSGASPTGPALCIDPSSLPKHFDSAEAEKRWEPDVEARAGFFDEVHGLNPDGYHQRLRGGNQLL